jgi:hypothetical protein
MSFKNLAEAPSIFVVNAPEFLAFYPKLGLDKI